MKIINFGSLNIDKVCSVEEFVQPGETIMATGYSVNAGGKGLNQSVAAARAGAQVLHAGAVGSDGLFLKEILADAGADVSCLRVMDTESGCAFIEVNSKGQNRIIVSAGTNRMYTEEYIKNVLEKAEAGDFVLLQNEINMVGEIIRLSHEKGCRVVFNASPIPGKPEELPLELVDIFMVNELEAAALAGTSTEGDFRDILKALQKKYPKAAIVMTLGKEGIPEASQNAVLNANYMMNKLKDLYTMAYDEVCMHEFVMSLEDLKKKAGVSAMDIAKGLLDNGIHPPTMYFPLIVHEALMVEPTETESKEVLDHAIEVFRKLYNDALENPESLLQAPVTTPVTRMDEVEAARHPVLKYNFEA